MRPTWRSAGVSATSTHEQTGGPDGGCSSTYPTPNGSMGARSVVVRVVLGRSVTPVGAPVDVLVVDASGAEPPQAASTTTAIAATTRTLTCRRWRSDRGRRRGQRASSLP